MIARTLNALAARRKQLNETEKEKGFTLIELLVVVIIIGILAAIAIPVFLNQRESAWKASVGSDLKNAAIVVETYGTSNNGSYAGFVQGANIQQSAGNKIVVTLSGSPTGTEFTIKGENENIKGGTSDFQFYNSAAGGLQKWGAPVAPVTAG